MPEKIDPKAAKATSERVVKQLGGKVLDGLPWLDCTEPRRSEEVAARALVLHAMLQIYFGAPIEVIRSWIATNGLDGALSRRDRKTLAKSNDDLTDQEEIDLYWYIEALWALVWAGSLIEDIPIEQPVGEQLASLLPDVQANENGSAFSQRFRMRSFQEIYGKLDLYYRAHWYAREGSLHGYSTGNFNLDIIMERRKALEWVSDRTLEDWDEAPDGT